MLNPKYELAGRTIDAELLLELPARYRSLHFRHEQTATVRVWLPPPENGMGLEFAPDTLRDAAQKIIDAFPLNGTGSTLKVLAEALMVALRASAAQVLYPSGVGIVLYADWPQV